MQLILLKRQSHDRPDIDDLYRMRSELESFLSEEVDFNDRTWRENFKAIIDFQDSEGSFNLLDSYEIPSDSRVDFSHMPTYICSAILMKAFIMDPESFEYESELSKGLKMSCARGLTGHGYDSLKGQIEALNIFKKGHIREFIDLYPDLCGEFTEMIAEITEMFYERESEANFTGSWGESYEEDIKAINEYFSNRNVFVYGTLMKDESNHGFLKSSEFISKGLIEGYDMYDVGWYPAIVKGDGMVIGELYQVPIADMPSIDMLEGEGDLYKKKCEIVNRNGEKILAFVYVYLYDVSDLEKIASWKEHIWYVSYGSNMLFKRFRCYIEGGSYKGSKPRKPCRDQSLPAAQKAIEIPYDMYYAEYSSWGGGGVSFLDTSRKGRAIGVAYLITREQFDHIAMQENGDHYPDGNIGWYRDIIDLGMMDGFEVKTITNNLLMDYNDPSPDYLDTLREGIRENRPEMSDGDIENYLMGSIR